jgi:Fe-S cluster assembly protein SufD
VNGRFAPGLSSREGLAPEVTAGSFRSLLASQPAELEPHLAGPLPFEDRAFAALAAAFAGDGAFVRVPRNLVVVEPLFAVFVAVPEREPAAVHPRLVFVAEPGSRATLVELHVGLGGGSHLSNALGELVVGENASLEHVKLQLEGAGTTHLAHVHALVARDGRFASRAISFGAALARHDVVATLAGPGAQCSLDALYTAVDQHVDSRSTVDHRAPHTTSRELYKGVLAGKSRGIFNGRVIVRPAAQKTDAQQRNANLLLSSDAEVDSKPQLEIEADDVKCSHGSTIGQLDADALFYLRARGLAEREARGMLTQAFAAQITDALSNAALRERVEAELAARLTAAALPGLAA